MAQKLKHDKYLEALCDELRPSYDSLQTNVTLYSNTRKRRKVAEIDVLAIKRGHIDAYEVKCSHRITKARKQLHKVKKHYPCVTNLFFFCGATGAIHGII